MKKVYETVSIEIISVESRDIITDSGGIKLPVIPFAENKIGNEEKEDVIP